MNRFLVAFAAFFALSAHPALAASPAAESAAKAINQIAADAKKLESYCKVIKDMDAAGEDEAKLDALGEQLEQLLQSFGPQYAQALEVSEDADEADGQAIESAFENLDEKCWE